MEGWLGTHKLNKAMLVSYERTWHCTGKSLHMQTMPRHPFPFHAGMANAPAGLCLQLLLTHTVSVGCLQGGLAEGPPARSWAALVSG